MRVLSLKCTIDRVQATWNAYRSPRNTVVITWPTAGWCLESQTNGLDVGISANWVLVPGSEAVTRIVIRIQPGDGTVFYRLVMP